MSGILIDDYVAAVLWRTPLRAGRSFAAWTDALLRPASQRIAEFDDECDAAIASQISLYGDATDHSNAQKQRNEPRGELPAEPAKPHTMRWYWTLYKQSDHWLGDHSVGHEGLSALTRLQRTGLVESLLPENGEKPFAVLTRKVLKEEMKAHTRRRPATCCRRCAV